MQITDIKIRKTFTDGPMKAIASVTFDHQLVVQVHPGTGSIHHGGPQDGRTCTVQRHSSFAYPRGHGSQESGRCTAVGCV